jgi:phosphoribosylformylglycinamidine (FGAM) synthase PurS component
MKKNYLLLMITLLLASCNSRNSVVSLNSINEERKQIAQKFAETFLKKCSDKEYSEITGFNISKRFQLRLSSDSLKKTCERIDRMYGKVTVEKLVSAHSPNSPKDFIDVFNFKIKQEKSQTPYYLHLGIYRDQNYIEVPFYFSKDENYYETIRKKYYKK